MRVEALLRIDGLRRGGVEAIARALAPDNKGLPRGSNITFKEHPEALEIHIEGEMEIGNLEWTLRDLLLCLRASQGVLEILNGDHITLPRESIKGGRTEED